MQSPLDKQHRFAAGFRGWYPWLGVLVLAYLATLTVHHWGQLTVPLWRIPVIILSFGWLIVIIGAAHLNRTYKKPASSNMKVAVVVPNHREDPVMLRAMLDSLDAQTRLPHALYLVENGETDGNAEAVFEEWKETTRISRPVFVHLPNPGKRDAQAWAIKREQEADIIMTVDGDTRLDPFAIEEGLKPFADSRVMSVAGLLIGQNRSANLLTRIIDISFVASFVNGRAAWSLFNSVAVNCGGLAFYRTWVVKKHLADYLSQTVMGKKASTGDDRMLTCYSALEGRTVFQQTSVAHTLLPVNLSHLTRQRARWWRSFWWGGIWAIRRFSPTRMIWWLVASQFVTFALYSVMLPIILLVDPIVNRQVPWFFFVYIAGLSYIRCARTLAIKRPDQSAVNQFLSFIVFAPLSTFLNIWLCSMLQWWGLATFAETGWKTRQKVEVSIAPEVNK